MKILITGARGMLGGMLCHTLNDLEPVCWDRQELDITRLDVVRERLMELQPDIVINAAAYTDVDGAEKDRETAFAVNADGVRVLAMVCRDMGATLVHFSTDYVFPGDSHDGYSEDAPPGPAVNIYGESKLKGEQALKEASPKYYLLRTAWLYGPGGKNFVDTMLDLGRDRDLLSVVHDQFGSPTYTADVAAAVRLMVTTQQYPPGIYHVVNQGLASWYEFAQEIFRLARMPVKVKPVKSEEFPRPAQRPHYSYLLNTRGPQLRPWQAALKDYLGNRI